MTVYDRSVRELACGLFERGGQRRDDQARGHDAVWDSLRVAVEELVLAVLLMCNKNWFDRAQGFEHRAHLELSSMIMRAAPPPGGCGPRRIVFPGGCFGRTRPGRMEEMTVPLDEINDIREIDAAGVPRAEIARKLRLSRNAVAKYADMAGMSPAARARPAWRAPCAGWPATGARRHVSPLCRRRRCDFVAPATREGSTSRRRR